MLKKREFEVMRDEIEYETKGMPNLREIEYVRLLLGSNRLRERYRDLCKNLDVSFSGAIERTSAERDLTNQISGATRLQVRTGVWIGKHNVDLFVPAVRASIADNDKPFRVMRGLVIEINGPIHNQELKLRKDEFKADVLLKLGIGVTTVENFQNRENPTVQNLIRNLKKMERQSSRARTHLWDKVFAWTILAHQGIDGVLK